MANSPNAESDASHSPTPEAATHLTGGQVQTRSTENPVAHQLPATLQEMLDARAPNYRILPSLYTDLRGHAHHSEVTFHQALEAVSDHLGNVARDTTENATSVERLRTDVSRYRAQVESLSRTNIQLSERLGELELKFAQVPSATLPTVLHSPEGPRIPASRMQADSYPTADLAQMTNPFPSATTAARPFFEDLLRHGPPYLDTAAPKMAPPSTHQQVLTSGSAPGPHTYASQVPQMGTPLVTTSERPVPAEVATFSLGEMTRRARLGPYCPGLSPITTLFSPFEQVLDYRAYRLRDTRGELLVSESSVLYKLKRQIDGLYPTLGLYSGTPAIRLLGFLTTLREAFDSFNASEAAAVRTLSYFLTGAAKDVFTAQTSPGTRTPGLALQSTWPYVVHSLLKRFLPDDELQRAYDKVTRATQREDEDESAFADRIGKAARDCNHVFSDRELVNYYVRGLLPAIRETVSEQLRRLGVEEQQDVSVARRAALAEGNTYRARHTISAGSSSKSRSRQSTLIVANEEDRGERQQRSHMSEEEESRCSTCPSPWYRDPSMPHLFNNLGTVFSDLRARDPEMAMNVARNLEALLFTGASSQQGGHSQVSTPSMFDGSKLEGRPIARPYEEVPDLTEEQQRFAYSVIPADYWSLNCWSCRTEGHSTFTCPHLTMKRRLYFAYCYYLHQVNWNPQMAQYLAQREATRGKRSSDSIGNSRWAKNWGTSQRNVGPRNSYPNRRERDQRKTNSVRFPGKQGVFVAAPVQEPAHKDTQRSLGPQVQNMRPTWNNDHDNESSDDAGNECGQT